MKIDITELYASYLRGFPKATDAEKRAWWMGVAACFVVTEDIRALPELSEALATAKLASAVELGMAVWMDCQCASCVERLLKAADALKPPNPNSKAH